MSGIRTHNCSGDRPYDHSISLLKNATTYINWKQKVVKTFSFTVCAQEQEMCYKKIKYILYIRLVIKSTLICFTINFKILVQIYL